MLVCAVSYFYLLLQGGLAWLGFPLRPVRLKALRRTSWLVGARLLSAAPTHYYVRAYTNHKTGLFMGV
uniref:Putative secreted protein n=1 Tax=Anopheles darlingi TaxID=43151 RepID=A0A2M4D3B6_ANODA